MAIWFNGVFGNTFASYTLNPVVSRSQTTIALLKKELRIDSIDTSHDEILAMQLMAAKEDADWFLNNPFVDTSNNPLPIPQRVESWVLKEAARLYQIDNGVDQESAPHISNTKWLKGPDYTQIVKLRINPGL